MPASSLSLAYVDESYTESLYFVGAVVVHGGCALELERALDAVVERASKAHGVDPGSELHGYDLFHASGPWSGLRGQVRARIGVYSDAMTAIGDHDVSIFLCGVDRVALQQRYAAPHPAHDVTLQHLLERLEQHGEEMGGPVLVIADEVSEHERHRTNLQTFRRTGTPGYLGRRLSHILDTLHFAPSRHSRFLQAVDLVTFLHQRRLTTRDGDPRAVRANEELWASIEHRIAHLRLWEPQARRTHKGPAQGGA